MFPAFRAPSIFPAACLLAFSSLSALSLNTRISWPLPADLLPFSTAVYDAQEVEVVPVWVNESLVREQLGYPLTARNAGIEGEVTLSLLIDRRGAVRDLRVIDSGHPLLEVACVESLLGAVFQPATRDGKAVPCWKVLDFSFEI